MRPPTSRTAFTGPECPRAEAIARLLDGQVSSDERESLESHLAACGRCYKVLTESTEVWWRLKNRASNDDSGAD